MSERNFESLRIWQEARVFVNDVYGMMENCRDYGFRDQIQRAAVSIMNNIAEGNESGSDAKYVNFLNIAKGSCYKATPSRQETAPIQGRWLSFDIHGAEAVACGCPP